MNERVYADGSAVRQQEWTGLWTANPKKGFVLAQKIDGHRLPVAVLFGTAEAAEIALGEAGYGPHHHLRFAAGVA